MGDPFSAIHEETGLDSTDFLFWIVAILLLFGLLFGSLIYNAASGDGGSQHSPTEEEHHEF